jgi:hypothetical protein
LGDVRGAPGTADRPLFVELNRRVVKKKIPEGEKVVLREELELAMGASVDVARPCQELFHDTSSATLHPRPATA